MSLKASHCVFMKYRHEEQTAKLVEKLYRKEEGIMWAERAVAGIDRDYFKAIRKMGELKAWKKAGLKLPGK
jgi:hypothetical protein